MKRVRKLFCWLTIAALLYCLPWLVQRARAPEMATPTTVKPADAVLVFGALVRDQRISPLQRERLLAAKHLLDTNVVKQIVVSNNPIAAQTMYDYLINAGVLAQNLAIDAHADKTPDTCRNEYAAHQNSRSLIFVSQGYHLTRIAYQCRILGVAGQLFPADQLSIIDRSHTPWWTALRVRGFRYLREAGLTWLVVVGYYR